MKTYLSIDLDYWSYSTEQSAVRCFDRVFSLGLPIYVAPYHHQLLTHMNESACDTLINVDFHSDLCDLHDPPHDLLNEGTWGNFVSWQKNGRFIWRYPSGPRVHDGYCHARLNPFTKNASGWKKTEMKKGLSDLPWDSVQAIGVCLSKYWLGSAPITPVTNRLGITHWRYIPNKEQINLTPFYWTAA